MKRLMMTDDFLAAVSAMDKKPITIAALDEALAFQGWKLVGVHYWR